MASVSLSAIILGLLQLANILGLVLWSMVSPLLRLCRKKQPPNFSCDIVLITGGAQGLGRELALLFSSAGATIVLWDINQEKLRETVSEITARGCEAFGYVVDVSKREEIEEGAERVREEVGNVSVLVNNAGIMFGDSIMDSDDTQVDLTFKINTLACYRTVKSFLPWMLQNNYGYVVNICSILSYEGLPRLWDYSASKAATLSFSETLRKELRLAGKNGVSVTAVCPYYISTGMLSYSNTLTSFLPPLKPKDVAMETVNAISEKKYIIHLPSFLYWGNFIKFSLPTKAYDESMSLFFGDQHVNNLKVRNYLSNKGNE